MSYKVGCFLTVAITAFRLVLVLSRVSHKSRVRGHCVNVVWVRAERAWKDLSKDQWEAIEQQHVTLTTERVRAWDVKCSEETRSTRPR